MNAPVSDAAGFRTSVLCACARFFLKLYIGVAAAMLGFVVWGLFLRASPQVDGLDPATPLARKLEVVGFLLFCLGFAVFLLRGLSASRSVRSGTAGPKDRPTGN